MKSAFFLLAIANCAISAQMPFTFPTWDKDPDVDATGNRIFASASELMQLWPGTVVVQGHSFSPSLIPAGTVFYHGRPDKNIPTDPEWLAFDFEHSYMFANGRNAHVLTLVSKRPLRVINFDGLSAHLSTFSQSIIMYGEVRGGGDRKDPAGTQEIAGRLCAWAAENGIDGFIRMEGHFELIECDFAASFDLVSALRVIPQDERTKGRGGRDVPRPEGWVGSLPTDSSREVVVAGKWHDHVPGEMRVRPQYSKFVTFYDPAVTSLVDSRRGKSRDEQTLETLSRADAQMKLAELEAAVAAPWDEDSGIDWASLLHVVVERYGQRLELLAKTLSNAGNPYETAFKARQQVLIMLAPHFTVLDVPSNATREWLTPVVLRCSASMTSGLPTSGLTNQEVILRGAVEDVMAQICRRLARAFHLAYDVEEKRLDAPNVVDGMQSEIKDLMTWLDWTQVWVKCRPACSIEEMCVVGRKDRRSPQCVRRPNA
ncbi:hypothetical protein FB45DRAFT_914014 [Roridomyces roridus]|uniref:Uncharacterized protein n=1 Tax=Roridomyces roridus TaxID=1738132 RepID=A0AAD7BX54_9AGAR|nr:hypothetical protein FB45DRAFT_914014 [Roridomyces roridus]